MLLNGHSPDTALPAGLVLKLYVRHGQFGHHMARHGGGGGELMLMKLDPAECRTVG